MLFICIYLITPLFDQEELNLIMNFLYLFNVCQNFNLLMNLVVTNRINTAVIGIHRI